MKQNDLQPNKRFIAFFLIELLVALLIAIPSTGQTTTTNSVSFDANVDLVSRYVWRGADIGHAPSIQPGLSVSWKDFKFGTWGAYKLNGSGDAETDFYVSKSFGFIDLAIWDYWNYVESEDANFFDYKKGTTSHLLEAQLLLTGKEKLPFNLLASYFFYGADQSKSIYLELQYEHHFDSADFSAFAGCQAKGSYYAEKAGMVNVGCTVKKSIPITDRYSLPIGLSLINNPASRQSWLVATISF